MSDIYARHVEKRIKELHERMLKSKLHTPKKLKLQYLKEGKEMKVICEKCFNEYDWNSDDIFMLKVEGIIQFACRNCLKIGKGFKEKKYHLRS